MKRIRASKRSAIAAMTLSLAVLAAGCGADDGNAANTGSGDQAQASASEGKKTLTVWYGAGDDAIKAVAEAYEEKHSDVKINLVFIADQRAGSGQKLLSAIAGGTPPDIAYFDRFQIGSWAAQGSLTDLTDKAKADGVTGEPFYKFAWNEANYGGRLYGLPLSTDARLMFYNKDHFKEAGLDPENPPKTIAQLESAAEKLTKKNGSRFERIGFIPWFSQGFLYTWGWVFGGDYYDAETGKVTAGDPKVVEALQWMVNYGKKYGIKDIVGFTDSAGKEQLAPFVSGQESMEVGSSELVASIKKFKPDLNYGVFPIPTPDGSNYTTWSGGWSFVVPKGSKQVDAAWDFMKFAASEEGQLLFNKAYNTLSVIPAVNEKLGYAQDPVMKQFVDILKVSRNRPVITQGALLWNEMKQATSKALYDQGNPQALLDSVTEKVNAELAKDAAKK